MLGTLVQVLAKLAGSFFQSSTVLASAAVMDNVAQISLYLPGTIFLSWKEKIHIWTCLSGAGQHLNRLTDSYLDSF